MSVTDIKKLMTTKKVVVGTKNVLKNLKTDKLAKVYVSSNCPAEVRDDLNHYVQFSQVDIIDVGMMNDELGTICKKPFPVSVLGKLK